MSWSAFARPFEDQPLKTEQVISDKRNLPLIHLFDKSESLSVRAIVASMNARLCLSSSSPRSCLWCEVYSVGFKYLPETDTFVSASFDVYFMHLEHRQSLSLAREDIDLLVHADRTPTDVELFGTKSLAEGVSKIAYTVQRCAITGEELVEGKGTTHRQL